jgi:hypothetical protein
LLELLLLLRLKRCFRRRRWLQHRSTSARLRRSADWWLWLQLQRRVAVGELQRRGASCAGRGAFLTRLKLGRERGLLLIVNEGETAIAGPGIALGRQARERDVVGFRWSWRWRGRRRGAGRDSSALGRGALVLDGIGLAIGAGGRYGLVDRFLELLELIILVCLLALGVDVRSDGDRAAVSGHGGVDVVDGDLGSVSEHLLRLVF